MNYLGLNYVCGIYLLLFGGAAGNTVSNVQLILSHKKVQLGTTFKCYCATVSGSSNVTWYKRKGENNYTISIGTKVEPPFSETGRYSVRQWEYDSKPFELEITGARKADEGIIGCREGGDYDESELSILGGITELFVDMKPEGGREVPYKEPGDVVHFSQPLPEFGYTAKCHVQATTRNISVTIKIAGKEVPSELSAIDADPINSQALQERIFLQHRYIRNFKPGPELHLQKLECIAMSPNYPHVEFRNHVILNVEHKPEGHCEVTQPTDCSGSITVVCKAVYNPSFIFAKWYRESSPDTYYGYHHEGKGVLANYTTNGEYRATFTLRIYCSDDLPDEDTLWFDIGNLVGSVKLSMALSRPPPTSTVPTTSTKALTSSTVEMMLTNNYSYTENVDENSPAYSGDQEEDYLLPELPAYDELLPETSAHDELLTELLVDDEPQASSPTTEKNAINKTTPKSTTFLRGTHLMPYANICK
ncbi:uncharacterized protein [Watersipora subatra]|uniref:uncharacterized protein n=1 Tax=Watersipora subatra TaxID=2589382 RepID=UPI00355C9696